MSYLNDFARRENAIKRKRRRRRIICLLVLVVLVVVAVFSVRAYMDHRFFANVKETEVEPKILTVSHKATDIFTAAYQKETDKQLSKLKKEGEYTFDNPLIVANAYGTNTTSLYYYAETDRESYAVCTVEADGVKAASLQHRLETLSGDKYVEEHEYEIIGLVPGAKNKVSMTFYDEKDRAVGKTHFYVTPKEDTVIPKILSQEEGKSKVEMSDGLFALLGHDKADVANIYFYDNNGVPRGRMPLNHYRTDRLLTIGKELVYTYDFNKIAFMNRLGKITRTIDVGNYEFHHDFMYDKKQGTILCLANDKSKDTIEDIILSVDIKTGKTTKLIDCEKLLPLMRGLAVQRKGGKNSYGGTELDWIHLNSFDLIGDGELILSSREHSSLIKLKNIYGKPSLDYVIHRGSIYNGTETAKVQLKREGGTFAGNAGQHTVTVEKDPKLPKGQYYLYMFNNYFGSATSIPTFDWSMYPGVGSFEKGDASYYSKFLVDEKKRTYKLAQQFELPYSSIVSSVQQLGGNIPFSSGMAKSYGEYDSTGKMIKTFHYEADKYSYRVMKYDFKNFYFR